MQHKDYSLQTHSFVLQSPATFTQAVKDAWVRLPGFGPVQYKTRVWDQETCINTGDYFRKVRTPTYERHTQEWRLIKRTKVFQMRVPVIIKILYWCLCQPLDVWLNVYWPILTVVTLPRFETERQKERERKSVCENMRALIKSNRDVKKLGAKLCMMPVAVAFLVSLMKLRKQTPL